ncbi:MAG: sigma-70 family RNA polymerase sigma factor [Planctomycetes bacterium]|nr:sigma-70 family RNA polymerase sigma factor [Planctomycetota bacterium]
MTEISPETIELCQRGDAAAFTQVVQRYERPLFAYVYRLGCTPPDRDAEDVVQEVFVKVYQSIHRYRRLGKGVFSTWLFAIAHNHCMSLGRRKLIEVQTRRGETSRSPAPSEATLPSPAETLSNREEVAHIVWAAGELPESLRSAFILRYYQDLPCREIATILNCNEGTVRSRLFRARRTVLQSLTREDSRPGRNDYADS